MRKNVSIAAQARMAVAAPTARAKNTGMARVTPNAAGAAPNRPVAAAPTAQPASMKSRHQNQPAALMPFALEATKFKVDKLRFRLQ